MPAIFISHSSLDQKVADDIKASLARLGFEQVFLDFDKDNRDRRRRELGEAALRGTVALPRRHPGADAELARLDLVPHRTRAGARARQGDPADHRARRWASASCCPRCRRSIWSTGTRAASSGSSSGCAPSPANWRAVSALDPDRPPYPGIHAFEAEDAAIYFGRDDETRAVIERLDARRTQGGARSAGDHRRVRLRQIVAAARRRAAAARAPPARMDCAAADPAREGAARNASPRRSPQHLGKPEEWRSWHAAARHSRTPSTTSTNCSRTCASATRATPRCCCRSISSRRCSPSRPRTERAAFLRLLGAVLDPGARSADHGGRHRPLRRARRPDRRPASSAQLTETFPLPPMPLDRVPRLVEGPARRSPASTSRRACRSASRATSKAPKRCRCSRTRCGCSTGAAATTRSSRIAEYEALGDRAARAQSDPEFGASGRRSGDRRLAAVAAELAALRDAFVPHLVRIRLEDGKRVRQAARLSELPADAAAARSGAGRGAAAHDPRRRRDGCRAAATGRRSRTRRCSRPGPISTSG